MREIEQHIADLDETYSLPDEKAQEAARAKINAEIRATFRTQPQAARAFLYEADLCDEEQAFAASELVEALAGGDAEELRLLSAYFEVAVNKVSKCPRQSVSRFVIGSYDFVEGRGRFEMLPQYLRLTRSGVKQLRRTAVDLLYGFDVATTAPGVRDELVRLLADPDWQVRRLAEDLLREEGALPPDYRRPLLDRIRRLLA
jgi:hypothetical protein